MSVHEASRSLNVLFPAASLIAGDMETTGATAQQAASPTAVSWESLWRPLHLPEVAGGAACPRSEGKFVAPFVGLALGSGPVFATFSFIGAVNLDPRNATDDGWYVTKVLWWTRPPESDQPILIRGRRIDGPGEMRFQYGVEADRMSELRLGAPGGTAADAPGWSHWGTGIFVRTPGCYAYQVDRADFSEVIVFEAVAGPPGELTPLPSFGSLPRELTVSAGVETGTDTIRLALVGTGGLAIRIDVGPTEPSTLELSGPAVHRLQTVAGPVLWQAHPEHDWPRSATWDDGRRRYRLEVLAGESRTWSEKDLQILVDAFADAAASSDT
ncbi:MAG: hypothetical protein ACRDJH_14635 [Thermomicrobiales bacterium]